MDSSRRQFIKKGSLFVFAVSMFGCKTITDAGNETQLPCDTTKDILGPFYRQNSPWREIISPENAEGIPLKINGKVFGSDCKTVLKDAIVDVWHCDVDGDYDNDTDAFDYRGRKKTSAKGGYNFESIYPGRYLNGRQYRPAHVHFRVMADGHKELVTQIYFKDDPYIDKDPWASDKSAAMRILKLTGDEKTGYEVKFNVYLTT